MNRGRPPSKAEGHRAVGEGGLPAPAGQGCAKNPDYVARGRKEYLDK